MLSREEVVSRVQFARPEVKVHLYTKARITSPGLFLCSDCGVRFKQPPRDLYSGLPKRCDCPMEQVEPWVPPGEEDAKSFAREHYPELTPIRISDIMGIGVEKVYVYLRGIKKWNTRERPRSYRESAAYYSALSESIG